VCVCVCVCVYNVCVHLCHLAPIGTNRLFGFENLRVYANVTNCVKRT
jgi:hypothetical protein